MVDKAEGNYWLRHVEEMRVEKGYKRVKMYRDFVVDIPRIRDECRE